MFGLTQENLADAAGLTTRTIEKVESGLLFRRRLLLSSVLLFGAVPAAADLERALRK